MASVSRNLRIFRILLLKNFLIRKKHWLGTLLCQIVIPCVVIFGFHAMSGYELHYTRRDANHSSPIKTAYFFGDIYYSPDNSDTHKFMTMAVKNCFSYSINDNRVKAFNNEDEALKEYSKNYGPAKIFTFTNSLSEKTFVYSMRVSNDLMSRYASFQDLAIQNCFNMEFINFKKGNSSTAFQIKKKEGGEGQKNISTVTLMLLSTAFAFFVMFDATYVTSEKTLGVNVLLQMNGVSIAKNFFSWFFSGILVSFLFLIPTMIIINIIFFQDTDLEFQTSNMFLIFLAFCLHAMHFLAFGFFLGSFFTRPAIVKLVVIIIVTVLFTVYFSSEGIIPVIPYLGILLPPFLQIQMFHNIRKYALMEEGLTWQNLFISSGFDKSAMQSAGVALIFSIMGTVLYFFLTIYVQNIKPGKYGAAKHPFYFLQCLCKNRNPRISTESMGYAGREEIPFENASKSAVAGIQVRGLKKFFPCGLFTNASVPALKGVSLDFYKNHITSLLGHNGAGKTTMMSIITGMTSASEGTVLVNGKNIENDMNEIYTDIGLCPQEDMFFPDLTVIQHLMIFGMLKRKNDTKAEISRDIDNILQHLNINDKRNTLPTQLSGGQKRRLCLGMALIGNARTLILDEPTSGMDPESRREAWDIILSLRTGKTIVITTHDMEEADVLGDRIAIMHEGALRCDATSMFLKNFYGQGNVQVSLSINQNCEPQSVVNALNKHGKIMNASGTRLEINVPMTENLPDALDNLEARRYEFGVTGMSVSLISLEQIFLEVSKDKISSNMENVEFPSCNYQKIQGFSLLLKQIYALMAKKGTYTWKNPGSLLVMFLLPLLAIILVGSLSNSSSKESSSKNVINLHLYNTPEFLILGISENNLLWKKLNKLITDGGGLIKSNPTKNKLLAKIAVNSSGNGIQVTPYPGEPLAMAVTLDLLGNAIVKMLLSDDYSIQTSFGYLPQQESFKNAENSYNNYSKFFMFFFTIFIVSVFFISHPLKEAVSGLKHLQYMTGVTPVVYWGTMMLFDLVVFFGISALSVSVMALFQIIQSFAQIVLVFLVLFLFFVNIFPMMYILSLTKKTVGFCARVMIYAPFGILLLYIIIFVARTAEKVPVSFYEVICAILRLVPHTSYFALVLKFASFLLVDKNGTMSMSWYLTEKIPLKMGLGDNMFYTMETDVLILCGTAVLYLIILMIIEYKVIPKVMKKMRKHYTNNSVNNVDDMVAKEKELVLSEINDLYSNFHSTDTSLVSLSDDVETQHSRSERCSFLAYELSKRYKKVQAVREVNFRVKNQECFGLLGINGAGKSTTFRMLTGEEIPDSGFMYLNSASFQSQPKKYLSQMGYCPQFSAILKCLNTMEHLTLFARLRGVPEKQIQNEIGKWISRMNLKAYMSQPSGTYSGGNKRRLSVAMAMMAEPSLVLLDEPTTGVDPGARRSLWNVISAAQRSGQSVILTSHSMDECEALCNRLSIMVDGAFVCFGASQELKQRFGAGFNVLVRLRQDHAIHELQILKDNLLRAMHFKLTDENSSLLTYQVKVNMTWRTLYDTMNGIKRTYSCVEDFAVVSGTLEQIFLKFAYAAKSNVVGNY